MQCKENPAPGAAVLSGAAMSLSPSQSFGGGDYKTVGGVSYRVSRVRVICMQEGSWIVDTASPDLVHVWHTWREDGDPFLLSLEACQVWCVSSLWQFKLGYQHLFCKLCLEFEMETVCM